MDKEEAIATPTPRASKALPTMNYQQLQATLKQLRAAGADVRVRINASFEILLAEYIRLTATGSQAPADRLVTLNSEVLHLDYLLDTLQATEGDRYRIARKVSKDLERIASELYALEVALGGEYQSLVDKLQQTVLNLSLFNEYASYASYRLSNP